MGASELYPISSPHSCSWFGQEAASYLRKFWVLCGESAISLSQWLPSARDLMSPGWPAGRCTFSHTPLTPRHSPVPSQQHLASSKQCTCPMELLHRGQSDISASLTCVFSMTTMPATKMIPLDNGFLPLSECFMTLMWSEAKHKCFSFQKSHLRGHLNLPHLHWLPSVLGLQLASVAKTEEERFRLWVFLGWDNM
jgi:hypothetical protein